uniref:protein FAM166B n=1 Tax=Solea senegalensis TaxID=28829 RepID=UPI001CD8F62D|nr:protein FAM166B [Solea senegalensis]
MDKYAPKFSKVLVTPDPHYVPGYTGYCPQLKYNMGRTYSQQTAELLTSPDVKRSGRLVLRTGHDPSSACTPDTAALTPRGVSDGTMKRVIPGYTETKTSPDSDHRQSDHL